ncbi:MAG: 6-bladed beta-propeller [Elusimicrobia bacterium]|nr:6-bladed beta-propeller [Elusimicrobiota bacterium]
MKRSLLLLILASAAVGAAPPAEAPPPQWPPAPANARLRFVSAIEGPRAAVAGRLGGFLRLLIGLDQAGELASDRLIKPTGVFVSSGTVFIADPGARGVLRYNEADGKGEWWPRSAGAGLLSPVSAAAAADGRLFILDSLLKKVFILDPEGNVKGELEGDPQGLGQPASLALSEKRIYVSDVKNHRVAVYGLEGTFLQSFGRRGAGPGEFNFPTYLWYDKSAGQLWVNDSGNFRAQWFDADGRYLGKMGENGNRPGYLARPRGIARDSEGHVYAADAAFDAFQIFAPDGRSLLFVGRAGGRPGEFSMPGGIFIDERDRVYVADTQNARVQIFQYVKEVQP